MERYIDITIPPSSRKIEGGCIYQWDHGLIMRVQSGGKLVSGHFSYEGQTSTIAVAPGGSGGVVEIGIPDILLMQARDIFCYLYYEDTNAGYTETCVHFYVIPRGKPASYTTNPGSAESYNGLIQKMTELTNAYEQMLAGYENFSNRFTVTEPDEDHIVLSIV